MIIDEVIEVISKLPYPVTQARIDPYTSDKDNLPAINVKYINESLSSMGHSAIYEENTRIEVCIYVGETATYYSTVKSMVDEVKTALFTDQYWFSKYRAVPSVSVHYDYVDGGETNYAVGRIVLELETTIEYEPVIPDHLETVYLEIDDMSPFDPNIDVQGPDGVIEITAPITLPQ